MFDCFVSQNEDILLAQRLKLHFSKKSMKYYKDNIKLKYKPLPIANNYFDNIDEIYAKPDDNNDYSNFDIILDTKNINFSKINEINNNQYCRVFKYSDEFFNDFKNRIGIIIHQYKPLSMIMFNDKLDYITDTYKTIEYYLFKRNGIKAHKNYNIDNRKRYMNIQYYLVNHRRMKINGKILNEFNLFKYFINYLIYMNNKERKIHSVMMKKFINFIYNNNTEYSFTYWINNILSKNYNDDSYPIKSKFIYNDSRDLFLIDSQLSKHSKNNRYVYKNIDDNKEYMYDNELIDDFVSSLIEYTQIFYENVIGIFNKKCRNCGERICINTYGFVDWKNCQFTYPWEFTKCKICARNLSSKNRHIRKTRNYDAITEYELKSKSYLSRLIKILSTPFINKRTGTYNYNVLYNYTKDKSNKYNFIDIINDFNTFLKGKLKYNQLILIKKKIFTVSL